MCVCLPLGGVYLHICLVYLSGVCHCDRWVFLCDGLSVCILASLRRQPAEVWGWGLCWVRGPQPAGLTGNRHVLTCPGSIPSSQRAPVQRHHPWSVGWLAGEGGLKEPKQPQPNSFILLAPEPSSGGPSPCACPLLMQALWVVRLGQGPETLSLAL